MDFNRVFDRLTEVSTIPLREQLVELLQKTWTNISVDYCTSVLRRKRSVESINGDDVARVELFPDEVRSATYSNINRWNGTPEQHNVDEWFGLKVEEQNDLLIEAFPNGQVYGV